jgi:hypothetical protein
LSAAVFFRFLGDRAGSASSSESKTCGRIIFFGDSVSTTRSSFCRFLFSCFCFPF